MKHTLGNCEIENGLCIKHGYSVSLTIQCPNFTGTYKGWQIGWKVNHPSVLTENCGEKDYCKHITDLQDKLHHGNMQIKELKAKLAWLTGKTTHKEFINR